VLWTHILHCTLLHTSNLPEMLVKDTSHLPIPSFTLYSSRHTLQPAILPSFRAQHLLSLTPALARTTSVPSRHYQHSPTEPSPPYALFNTFFLTMNILGLSTRAARNTKHLAPPYEPCAHTNTRIDTLTCQLTTVLPHRLLFQAFSFVSCIDWGETRRSAIER
jgi:hypothetical protein